MSLESNHDLYKYLLISMLKSNRTIDLYENARKLFDLSEVQHSQIHKDAQITKDRVKIRLKISIIEAQDLLLKQRICNSYCNVHFINENQTTKPNRSTSSSPALVTPNSSPLIKRLESIRVTKSVTNDGLIVSSKVCHDTRNPVWNESHPLETQDFNKSKLFIQIYDSCETRFLSPVGDVSSETSSISRRNSFKERLKTFALRTTKQNDYLLGQLYLHLSEVKESIDSWYSLLCRHNDPSHKPRGRIHLKLEFEIVEEECAEMPDVLISTNQKVINEALIKRYYELSKLICTRNLSPLNSRNKWNGSLNQTSRDLLKCFCDSYYIKRFSRSLIDIIILMELNNDYPNLIDESMISIRLEDLFCHTNITLNAELSTFEKEKFKNACCLYESLMLKYISLESDSFTDVISFTNRLKAIVSYYCGYESMNEFEKSIQQSLTKNIETKIIDVIDSLQETKNATLDNLSLLRYVDDLNATIVSLLNFIQKMSYHSDTLAMFHVDCKRFASYLISNKLSNIIKHTLQRVCDEFKQEFIRFPENIKGCANSTFTLYNNVRKLTDILSGNIPERELFKLKIIDYAQWFKSNQIPSIWLTEFTLVANEYILKSTYKEDTQEVASTGKSMTSVVLANRFIQFCDDWIEKIDFQDIEVKFQGIVSIIQLTCDCCQLFVQRLKSLLEESNYFFGQDLSLSRSYSDSLIKMTKITICINDINHLKITNILTLTSRLKCDEVIGELANQMNDEKLKNVLRQNLNQIINETVRDIDSMTIEILDKMTASSLYPKVISFYKKNNLILIDYVRRNLCLIKKKLIYIYDKFIGILYKYAIDYMYNLLPENEKPSYYMNISRDLDAILDFFFDNELPKQALNAEIESTLKLLREKLKLYSKSNSELISEYLETLNYDDRDKFDFGTLFFKIGYEKENTEFCRLNIKIISCKNIPILDRINQSSDPYVHIEFLPNEYYNGLAQTKTIYKQLNPTFNEEFTFEKIPIEFFARKDICLRFSVWDEDVISNDDFAGELFFPLSYIENMDNVYSIDSMKMIKALLKRPSERHLNRLKELERRSEFDREAKKFYDARFELIMQSKTHSITNEKIKSKIFDVAFNALNTISTCFPT